jgi:hypothetical protein
MIAIVGGLVFDRWFWPIIQPLLTPAEAGTSPLLYGTPEGQTSSNQDPARRVSFSELLGANLLEAWPTKAGMASPRWRSGRTRPRS